MPGGKRCQLVSTETVLGQGTTIKERDRMANVQSPDCLCDGGP